MTKCQENWIRENGMRCGCNLNPNVFCQFHLFKYRSPTFTSALHAGTKTYYIQMIQRKRRHYASVTNIVLFSKADNFKKN